MNKRFNGFRNAESFQSDIPLGIQYSTSKKKKEWFFYRFELASDRLECAQLPLNAIHQEARVELDGLSGVHQPTFPYQAEP